VALQHPGHPVSLAADDHADDFGVTAMRVEMVTGLRAAGVVVGVEGVAKVDIEGMS
jgi:hypothetical protein